MEGGTPRLLVLLVCAAALAAGGFVAGRAGVADEHRDLPQRLRAARPAPAAPKLPPAPGIPKLKTTPPAEAVTP